MCVEYRRSPFAFVLTTGDNFSAPDGVATAANFTRPERCLPALGVRWRATWGNHDVAGTSTADVLGSPRRYYAVVVAKASKHEPQYQEARVYLRRHSSAKSLL